MSAGIDESMRLCPSLSAGMQRRTHHIGWTLPELEYLIWCRFLRFCVWTADGGFLSHTSSSVPAALDME